MGDLYKCSAVAEMGDRLAAIDMGRKEGLLYPFRGAVKLGPHLTQCRLGRGLLPPTKSHRDRSSRLATTDMGRTVGVLCPFSGELSPHLT